MGIPFYRFVSSEPDGHSTHQCLSCKKEIYAPSLYSWKFCPFCGIEWQGELKWDEEKKAKHKCWYPYGNNTESPSFTMVIQERTQWRNEDTEKPWQDSYSKWDNIVNTGYSLSKYSLERWQLAVADARQHEFYKSQVRLVIRYPNGNEKVVLSYLPALKGN